MPEIETNVEAPTKGAIAKATGIAFLAALVLLFAAVLPAEYGVDPLKTGKLLGLTGIAAAGEDNAKGRAAVVAAPGSGRVNAPENAIYKVDSQDFSLSPGDGVEMKYHMQKGAVMVYAWKATANVAFEFHGEPDQKPNKDYFESYELDDKLGKDHSYGSFTAPKTGIHGWFWENKGKTEVMIHLTTAGFFDSAKMYSGDEPPTELTIEDAK